MAQPGILVREWKGLRPNQKSVVDDLNFVLATRETGYRSLSTAVAELVDNALQAGATEIGVLVLQNRVGEPDHFVGPFSVGVLDNGIGMDRETLWTALQFGGTERFDDRSGLGRFGMGLPNSSVSQARRLEVYSWRRSNGVLWSYLDVDELAAGVLREVPRPVASDLPAWAKPLAAETGTLVLWNRCDRLAFRKLKTICQRLHASLGRMYRYPIWGGVRITINGEPLTAIDPLFCAHGHGGPSASPFGVPMTYEVALAGGAKTSTIKVRFTELPVAEWRDLGADEKRARGIVGGAGVSFVRAGREIDYGWQLLGGKRKENYDDWWRCEVSFTPLLDEFFGVTHSKQGVAPTPELQAMLSPDLESVARILNNRVRVAFESLKKLAPSRAAQVATRQEVLLPPTSLSDRGACRFGKGRTYAIRTAKLSGRAFFDLAECDGKMTVTINTDHPFYKTIYSGEPAMRGDEHRYALESLILAAARAEAGIEATNDKACLKRYRAEWGDALVAFLERRV